MPRFLVEGQWEDETYTITQDLIDAADEKEAEKLVNEVLDSDPACGWRLRHNTWEIGRKIQALKAELEALEAERDRIEPFTQEEVAADHSMRRCVGCRKFMGEVDVEDGKEEDGVFWCMDCIEARRTRMPGNPYEEAARAKKATSIASILAANKIPSSKMELAGEVQWGYAEKLAGVKPSSLETRAAVVKLMKEMEGHGAK